MTQKEMRLNCTNCGDFTHAHRKRGDPDTVARCNDCGKKHSNDSIHFVDLNRDYERDEDGELTEDVL